MSHIGVWDVVSYSEEGRETVESSGRVRVESGNIPGIWNDNSHKHLMNSVFVCLKYATREFCAQLFSFGK